MCVWYQDILYKLYQDILYSWSMAVVSMTIENCTLRAIENCIHRRSPAFSVRSPLGEPLARSSDGSSWSVPRGGVAGRCGRRTSLGPEGPPPPPRIWSQGARPGFQVSSVEVGSSRRFPRWTNRTAPLGRTGRLKGSRLGGRLGHLVQVGLGGHSASVRGRQGGCRLQPRAGSRPCKTEPAGVCNSEPGAPGAPGAPGSLRIAPTAGVTVPDAGDRPESRPCQSAAKMASIAGDPAAGRGPVMPPSFPLPQPWADRVHGH